MSIATYSELRTAVENWLDHTLFTARVPEFIALFEAAANRRLRARQQEASSALTPSAGSAALPARLSRLAAGDLDGLATRGAAVRASVVPAGGLSELARGRAAHLHDRGVDAERPPGRRRRARIRLFPEDSLAVLRRGQGTNWLLAAHPDLYLFGALVEAEMFGVNDERAPVWKARRDEIFDEIEQLNNKTRGAGAIRVTGVTP